MKIDFRPIILAGGSGTRFWPRSRKARAKQVLALDGKRTMIQRTVDRLAPLADASDVWVITNDLLSEAICGQLDCVPANQVILARSCSCTGRTHKGLSCLWNPWLGARPYQYWPCVFETPTISVGIGKVGF